MPDDKDTEQLDPYLFKRFEVQKLLGRGAYGIVWRVVEKESGRVMALKRCFDAFQNSTDAQRTFREIMFLQELNGHENIVRLMNVLKAESHQDLYVLFDYMESDLQHVIAGSLLKPIHIEYITYQILKAMKYIHTGGVLHRDLKPSNVLLNTNCHVRICDFGLARTATAGKEPGVKDSAAGPALYTDYVATRWYRAPELLLGATLYNEGVDMWSVGCIIGEMISGKPILKGRSTMDQLEKIMELTGKPAEQDLRPITSTSSYARTMIDSLGHIRQMPSTGVLFLLKAPPDAKNLALNMLKFNPERRPSAELALEDPYVEKFHLQEAEPTCDKIIRMPIADTAKLKAGDYRAQIYALIAQRRKMQREEAEFRERSPGRATEGRSVSKGRKGSKESVNSVNSMAPE
eukprot:CAMPEP_0180616700 /NCGR_PEP_ID=MMETSP1037_2-20121125/32622_1 /TAXON_ID=632150 /ORGANISM="Azadinium spinosum, Strain 3D9" /LENGTH=403 /DNA_ID=CAMNT_0022636561 /DNA_START=35 /DNA_END=1243 /DNA_ORIENTATION=-